MNILCPKCKKTLIKQDKIFRCENRHSYDIAKEGYLNLNMRNSQNTGDNQTMIKARTDFLNKGYYAFLRDKIDSFIDESDILVDLACGQGYYTSYFKAFDKVGVDLSKIGLRHASKNDKSSQYILNSIFHNPLEDKCADKVITIFAPIAKLEIPRLLKDDGLFILARPDVYHLYELKEAIYDNPYLNKVENIEIEGMHLKDSYAIEERTLVKKQDIPQLFMMTPYYNTSSVNDKMKVENLNDMTITFAFIIDIYKKG